MAIKLVTSRDNPVFKSLKRLADSSRDRRKSNQTLLDGVHLIGSWHAQGHAFLRVIVPDQPLNEEITALLVQLGELELLQLPVPMFNELAPVNAPTGILAQVEILNLAIPAHPTFALLLEDIQDPGNLGSLLRTAAAAGVDVVWCSQGCTDVWSPKALRGGQGAHAILPIVERANLDEVVTQFTGQILAASPIGKAMYALNMQTPTAWMIGNEGAGLSESLMAKASDRVAIPMPGKIESLNAAAAGAICLFEVVRQRSLV